jgi:hypothetical protein
MRSTSLCVQLNVCRWISCCAALAVLAATAGCGRPAHQLETAPVSGSITLDGEPLPSGYVVVPTAKGRMASAKIQPDGTFVFTTYKKGDGVQVGIHPVTVDEVPRDEFSSVPANLRLPIPERYKSAGTSGLTVEVKPGEKNRIELHLVSKDDED